MGWRAVRLATIALPLCLIAELLPIRSYTTADGLAADQINDIVVDSRGFVWFCTPEGLSRFDGYRFVNFGVAEGLPHRSVHALLETRSGTYLVATARGLSEFQAGHGGNAFTTYLPGNKPFENFVTALMQDSAGRIWCGTGSGLFEMLSGHKFRRQPLPAPQPPQERIEVSDLLEDAGHNLWVATTSGIYVIGKGGAVQHIASEDGLPHEWVNALLLDKQGRTWAGTRGGLVLMRVGNEGGRVGVQQVYRDIGGEKGFNAQALAEGPDRTMWAGASIGIVRLLPDRRPVVFQGLTRANGLIDRSVTALATDRAGNIWAGTEGAGVMKIQPAGFTTFREQDGLASDRVFSVLADGTDAVLAVTVGSTNAMRSVNVFDGIGFHALVPKVIGDQSTWGQQQILLQSRSGEWWAATKVGLCRFPPVKAADLARTPPKACYARDTAAFRVFEDSKGRIWASAQSPQGDRLMLWDPTTKAISSLNNAISSFNKEGRGLVSAFAEDRNGAIWMGFWGGGLLRYDGRQFTRFTSGDGVPAGVVWALLADSSGRLWIGAGAGGLGLVENPGSAQLQVKVYNTTNGQPAERLASNTIYCIVEDKAGRIYACTAKGVDRLNPKTGDVKHFSVADGLAHGALTTALRDATGDLWFATMQGLSRLTPTADRPPAVPSVRIVDLRVGRDRYPVSQVGETRISRGDLQPSQNQFQVGFVGFNDEPEESLRYKYKLEGGDSGWLGPGRDHQANYPGLEPGPYRFLVKAVNSAGGESTAPAEVDFVVLPPFWRSWWFETLALASLAGLVFAAHRYRVSQAVQIERMRTAIATDLHDDIGASLSQIAILSELARGDAQLGQPGPNERLERVAKLARELVDSMSDIVWSMRAEPEGVDSLIRRMREFANDLLESQAIAFELRAPGPDTHLQLSLQARRQILLIFKECLHNAARHSGCTAVEAEMRVEGREILLRVRDNGRGLSNAAGAHRSNGGTGIPSMRRRAESLGGAMQWTPGPEGGCTAEVRLPMRHGAFRQ
jgi:ligand-binding sensor domain-containing protein/signal transduction histidine kinase